MSEGAGVVLSVARKVFCMDAKKSLQLFIGSVKKLCLAQGEVEDNLPRTKPPRWTLRTFPVRRRNPLQLYAPLPPLPSFSRLQPENCTCFHVPPSRTSGSAAEVRVGSGRSPCVECGCFIFCVFLRAFFCLEVFPYL